MDLDELSKETWPILRYYPAFDERN